MPRWMPLLLTVLIFLIVVAIQLWFLIDNANVSYLVLGAILLFIGAAAVVAQAVLLFKSRRPRQ